MFNRRCCAVGYFQQIFHQNIIWLAGIHTWIINCILMISIPFDIIIAGVSCCSIAPTDLNDGAFNKIANKPSTKLPNHSLGHYCSVSICLWNVFQFKLKYATSPYVCIHLTCPVEHMFACICSNPDTLVIHDKELNSIPLHTCSY